MGGIDRRLVRASRPARTHLLVAGVLACCAAALIVAQASLLADVVARAFVDGAALGALRGVLVALAAVTAGRAVVGAGFELAGRWGAAAVMRDLRGRLVERVLREGRGRGERGGELAATAVQGVDALEAYFAGYLPQLVLAATVPIAVLAWTALLSVAAAVILAITVPILIVFMVLVGLRANARTTARWRTLALLSAHFVDVVGGLPTLRAFGREEVQARRVREIGEAYRRETLATLRVAFLSAFVLELCAMVGTALVAATVGIQLAGGHLELRAGLTVLLLAPELYGPLRGVGQQFHAAADGTAAAARLLDAIGEDPEPAVAAPAPAVSGPEPAVGGAAPAPAASGPAGPRILIPRAAPDPAVCAVRLEGVRFAHPDRAPVLRGVDLAIEPGAMTALVGDSGAGKSTLAALVLGFERPGAGRISCGGVDLAEVDVERWRARIAWVPQQPHLFGGTLGENIALWKPRAADEAIRRAASAVGLGELVASLPDGLATRVGDGGRPLSAGQAHRVALARAFLAPRSLLILDEPTAHLDPATAGEIGAAIATLSAGRAALVITHDEALAARAGSVAELTGGRARPRETPRPAVAA